MVTIPASAVVSVTPSVLSAGGAALDMIGLLLTTSTRPPINTVPGFSTPTDVGNYFGFNSAEYTAAVSYFLGFNNSQAKPGNLLFAQYPQTAVGAYLRGGNISASLAAIQAVSGTLSVVMDGDTYSAASVVLSAATSFSDAANTIQTDLNAALPNAATVTGSITSTTMTVTAVASGNLAPGQLIAGTSVTGSPTIVSQLTSTETDGHFGGKGTYTLSHTETVGSETLTATASLAVTFDSVSGAFIITSGTTGALSTSAFAGGTTAAALGLTLATGAVLSQGAGAASPIAFMANLIKQTQDWAGFATLFNPDNSGFVNKLLFSQWTNGTNKRYVYAAWDADLSPTTTVPATGSFGYAVAQAEYDGTCLIFGTDNTLAVFVLGTMASINFGQTNGRITFAFRSQDGIVPTVTDATVANNLIANGYNFYGAYALAAQGFQFFNPGFVSGEFEWLDSYVDEIWLNNALQLALMILLTNSTSVPFTPAGYAAIEVACADPIAAAVNFGAIRSGVTLSSSQAAEVNANAGVVISDTLQTRGWYLQVKDAAPTVRQARGSPPINFWYTDGGSIQKIELNSIELQ